MINVEDTAKGHGPVNRMEEQRISLAGTQGKGYYDIPHRQRIEASYGFSMRMKKGKVFLKHPKTAH